MCKLWKISNLSSLHMKNNLPHSLEQIRNKQISMAFTILSVIFTIKTWSKRRKHASSFPWIKNVKSFKKLALVIEIKGGPKLVGIHVFILTQKGMKSANSKDKVLCNKDVGCFISESRWLELAGERNCYKEKPTRSHQIKCADGRFLGILFAEGFGYQREVQCHKTAWYVA